MPYPRLAAVKNGSNDLKFGTQSGHLLKIVHAKFKVNAAIFAAARPKNGIFAAFYSILIT